MNPEDQLRAVMAERVPREVEASRRLLEETSAARLSNAVRRKVQTAFVGALARFEQAFGRVWGHALPAHDCTQAQMAWRAIWDKARAEILDNGNDQLRALKAELDLFDVTWRGYRMELPAAPEEGNG